MSRPLVVLLFSVATIAAFSVLAGTASAATAPFTVSSPNNIVVHKGDPNLMFTINETNNSGATASCYVYIEELNFSTSVVEIASGATIGLGAPFPTTKKSELHFDMFCDGALVATSVSKVTMTGQAG